MHKTELAVHSVIGFSGGIKDGLNLHPNNEDLVYAIGSSIISKNAVTGKQFFLKEHTNKISIVKVSPNGKYIVTGETSELGQQATVIVWDFLEKRHKHKLKLHKTHIASLDFSRNEFFLATQGGKEDKNMLIIWDLENGKSLYGTPNKREVKQIKYFNESDAHILTVSQTQIQIQFVDKANKKIITQPIAFGTVKRIFTCCDIDKNDCFAYVGTESGDFFEIWLEEGKVKRSGPTKKLFAQGITCIKIAHESNNVIIGTGDGTLSRVSLKDMQIQCKSEVMGAVTSISFNYDFTYFFCGTKHCNIFFVKTETLSIQLKSTAHSSKINDVCFPKTYSDVFATCSMNQVRLWNVHNQAELLRIQIPRLECFSVGFPADGKSIVTGWADGRIRTFLPQSGKLVYLINDAHLKGVTALAFFNNLSDKIVSGGAWGEVRVWQISKNSQYLLASLKEHCGRVNSLEIIKNDSEVISCSSDGSCAIWNLNTYDKINSFEDTQSPLCQVVVHPKQFQFLTVSTNGNICYRQKFDIQLLKRFVGCPKPDMSRSKTLEREALLSLQEQARKKENKKDKTDTSGVNSIVMMNQGKHFVTGGGDKILKLWDYEVAKQRANGVGHSEVIIRIGVSPDQQTLVSVSEGGEIFFWDIPKDLLNLESGLGDPKPLGREQSDFSRRG